MPTTAKPAPSPASVAQTLQCFPPRQREELAFLLRGYDDASEDERRTMIETIDDRKLALRMSKAN